MLRLSGLAHRLQTLPRAPAARAALSRPATGSRRDGTAALSAAALDASGTAPPPDHRSVQQVPSQVYHALVKQSALTLDRAQAHVLRKYLDKLHKQLSGYTLPDLDAGPSAPTPAPDVDRASASVSAEPQPPPPQAERKSVLVPRGLYLHGSVGTGKSMLMDLFFANVATAQKRRVHFNKFMLEVHERIQKHKQAQLARYGRQRHIDLDPSKDVITRVAEEIARESHVLCFDEFQVTDIADALIMRKLFGVFFARGVVMVATSNTPPQSLYRDGTNREYFLPFLDQLARHTKVVAIESETDYRMLSTAAAGDSTFLYPLSDATAQTLDALYDGAIGGREHEAADLRIPVMMGRELHVRGSRSGVARVTFDVLCNTEKGAADYKALCELVLEQVPSLSMQEHDQARRFILLIDELYEHRTRLICSSAVPTHAIFNFDDASIEPLADESEDAARLRDEQLAESAAQGIPPASSWDGPVGAYNPAKMAGLQVQNLCSLQDLKVAFKRAVSRLQEMQSDKYLAQNAALQPTRQARLRDVLQ